MEPGCRQNNFLTENGKTPDPVFIIFIKNTYSSPYVFSHEQIMLMVCSQRKFMGTAGTEGGHGTL